MMKAKEFFFQFHYIIDCMIFSMNFCDFIVSKTKFKVYCDFCETMVVLLRFPMSERNADDTCCMCGSSANN